MGSLVSGIGNLLGGGNNSGFNANQATLQTPTTAADAQGATQAATGALSQQQQLAQALGAQNGIGNQSAVFQQQQQLANALQQLSQGQGPNPAQAALAQNTSANTANQAALMAGQRGSNQNVGLIARQAAMQGAGNQQAAVGQEATLAAQQQIAAQQNLMQQQSNQANLATQQVGQQQNAVTGLNTAAQGLQGNLLGSINAQNTANVANTGQANSANSSIASTNANNSAGAIGGLLNSIGGAAKMAFAKGGTVPPHISAMASIHHPGYMAEGGEAGNVPGEPEVQGDSSKNDTVPAMLSPGEIVIPNHITQAEDAPQKAAEFVAEQLQKKHGSDYGADAEGDFHKALKEAIKSRSKKDS